VVGERLVGGVEREALGGFCSGGRVPGFGREASGGRLALAWRKALGGRVAVVWRCDSTPSQSHPVGGMASQAVSPSSPVGEYPPRKETPKSTHAGRRPGEDAPSDKQALCVQKFTCLRRRP